MVFQFGNTAYETINVIGHLSGVAIFATFLYMLLRRTPVRLHSSRLAIGAATCALIWNLASLVVLTLPANQRLLADVLATLGLSALSVLPAILLHISVGEVAPRIVRIGYVLSGLAVLAHALELLGGPESLHRVGIGLITVGFVVLTVIVVAGAGRAKGGDEMSATPRQFRNRLLAAMSLFLFAISFVHFSDGESHQAWSTELAFHHAGIPLALFILIQDYRFVLLDAFLRVLANGLLAGLFALALVLLFPLSGSAGQLGIAVVLLASFAWLRGALMRFLNRIVFHQIDPDAAVETLRQMATHARGQQEYLEQASAWIAQVMESEIVEVPEPLERTSLADAVLPTPVDVLPAARELRLKGAVVVAPVRLASGGVHPIWFGERKGGRRYLSQDLETLARLTACVSEQAERIREAELQRLAARAELAALQSQIHPHFLFNALNTLYGIIPREAASARATLLNLGDILRYLLRPGTAYIALEEELRIVQAYLAIEALRLGNKLTVEMDIDEGVRGVQVPALSVEPLAENAVKHGIAPFTEGGTVRVEAKAIGEEVRIRVLDSGAGFGGFDRAEPAATADDTHFGVGLDNVRRRLELCYGREATLEITREAGWTSVGFRAPRHVPPEQAPVVAAAKS